MSSDALVVTGITDATSVAIDADYGGVAICAVLSTGGVDCWGEDDGPVGFSDVPVAIAGITDATSVAISPGDSTCVLLSSGGIDCWGSSLRGELGNGTEGGISDVPVAVTGITDATSVTSTDNYSSCARLSTGGIDCWGNNESGIRKRYDDEL